MYCASKCKWMRHNDQSATRRRSFLLWYTKLGRPWTHCLSNLGNSNVSKPALSWACFLVFRRMFVLEPPEPVIPKIRKQATWPQRDRMPAPLQSAMTNGTDVPLYLGRHDEIRSVAAHISAGIRGYTLLRPARPPKVLVSTSSEQLRLNPWIALKAISTVIYSK